MTTPLDRVREWWREGAKRGLNLSPADLRRRCAEEGIQPPPASQLRDLRNRWVASAVFSEPRRRQKGFASAAVYKLGTVFVGELETMQQQQKR